MDIRVGFKYRIKNRIGGGSFGEIFSGEHVLTGQSVAIKLESVKMRPPQLNFESKIYSILNGATGFPSLKWYGVESGYNAMVIEMLGKSLEECFTLCKHKFSLKTVLMLADQMICRIEYLHSKGIIHRDIKPDNFMTGVGKKAGIVYMIDFGLSKKYYNFKTSEHINFETNKSLIGTARYSSINAHKGYEQSRRDDMEAIAYVLIYFMKGSLPWQGINVEDRKKKYEMIGERKMSALISDLCEGLPEEFAIYLRKVRELEFKEKPDYKLYRKLFRDCFIREGYVYDYVYDWTPQPTNTSSTESTSSVHDQYELPDTLPILPTSMSLPTDKIESNIKNAHPEPNIHLISAINHLRPPKLAPHVIGGTSSNPINHSVRVPSVGASQNRENILQSSLKNRRKKCILPICSNGPGVKPSSRLYSRH